MSNCQKICHNFWHLSKVSLQNVILGLVNRRAPGFFIRTNTAFQIMCPITDKHGHMLKEKRWDLSLLYSIFPWQWEILHFIASPGIHCIPGSWLIKMLLWYTKLSLNMTKPTKWHVRPAKTQISLAIRPVWSESSLCVQWVAKDPIFLDADSEDWTEWADAQVDLSLPWAHMAFC